ncbi:type II toxin-antitoxin system VapB family antitoxin [Nocardioides massiliensis]|uniref:Antitoxin VapB n=1 Tax=Nocardioides massiliensis TaxID=1325935 RepID=A0ABT9NJD7_9ACTN|nr:type II toxin-antitoxin system VapB family antitoxin [Nocardioides massiliensis]MDP9820536.1 antitoxin VapB [Nocardioides massiliensis]
MATMNIKDPEVHRLAHELAARRGTSATRAVREALEDALARDKRSREGIAAELLELSAEFRASNPRPGLDPDDLYDERGLPR